MFPVSAWKYQYCGDVVGKGWLLEVGTLPFPPKHVLYVKTRENEIFLKELYIQLRKDVRYGIYTEQIRLM